MKGSDVISIVLVIFLLLISSSDSRGDSSGDANRLIQFAREKKMAEDAMWLGLNHYNAFGKDLKYSSDINNQDYFLNFRGYGNSIGELETTIRCFFGYQHEGKSKLKGYVQRFPGRYLWLKYRLEKKLSPMDRNLLVHAKKFKKWLKKCEKHDVYFVMVSNGKKISQSFGHTMIEIKTGPQLSDSEFINFGVPDKVLDQYNIFTEKFVAIVSNLIGNYERLSYYAAKQKYLHDDRELKRYKIIMNKKEKNVFLGHVWELTKGYMEKQRRKRKGGVDLSNINVEDFILNFNYNFPHENCVYHILSLMGVAVPKVRHIFNEGSLRTVDPEDVFKLLRDNNVIRYY